MVVVPERFADRCWDGSDGTKFQPTLRDLPTYDHGHRTVPPFDLLVESNWPRLHLAVGPPVEVSVLLLDAAAGPLLLNLALDKQLVSVAVGRGDAPDVFVRLSARSLIDVRAGRAPFLSVFLESGAALDGDDGTLLYLAGIFDDELWTHHWGLASTDLEAAESLVRHVAVS